MGDFLQIIKQSYSLFLVTISLASNIEVLSIDHWNGMHYFKLQYSRGADVSSFLENRIICQIKSLCFFSPLDPLVSTLLDKHHLYCVTRNYDIEGT